MHYKSADFTHQNFILLWYLTWLAAFSCGFRSSLEKSCHTWKSQPDLIFCSNIRARVTTPLNWPSHTKFSTIQKRIWGHTKTKTVFSYRLKKQIFFHKYMLRKVSMNSKFNTAELLLRLIPGIFEQRALVKSTFSIQFVF